MKRNEKIIQASQLGEELKVLPDLKVCFRYKHTDKPGGQEYERNMALAFDENDTYEEIIKAVDENIKITYPEYELLEVKVEMFNYGDFNFVPVNENLELSEQDEAAKIKKRQSRELRIPQPEIVLPKIDFDHESLLNQLDQKLQLYNVVVDESAVKEAKKAATEINKISGEIDKIRKEKAKELKAPIVEFEGKCKTLTDRCQQKRKELTDQVRKYEDKEIKRALGLLEQELIEKYQKHGIDNEFKSVEVKDLAILSNLTKTGLAKKAVEAIEARVMQAKQHQEQIKDRLMQLEGKSLNAGLHAALTPKNIEHFLYTKDNEEYDAKLDSLIQNELRRQDEAERKKEQEQARKQAQQKPQTPPTQEPPKTQQQAKPANNHYAPKKSGVKVKKTITATFEVEVDEAFSDQFLEQFLKSSFKKGGIKTVPTVRIDEVQEQQEEEAPLEGSLF